MSDSTSDSSKPSDQFDNSETKIRNRETCLEARFYGSSVVYKAVGVDYTFKHYFSIVYAKPCDRLDNFKLCSVVGFGFLIDHGLSLFCN